MKARLNAASESYPTWDAIAATFAEPWVSCSDASCMRQRASQAIGGIRFDQGGVEELPYADGKFDVVMSMFGVMFAARPNRVVAELARVTRRGGRVALANWTPDGFIGTMLRTHAAWVPAPAGVPTPLLWGDLGVIRQLFDARSWELSTIVRTLTFRYPHLPAGTADLLRTAYGRRTSARAPSSPRWRRSTWR